MVDFPILFCVIQQRYYMLVYKNSVLTSVTYCYLYMQIHYSLTDIYRGAMILQFYMLIKWTMVYLTEM
jgi:hypothetical protein